MFVCDFACSYGVSSSGRHCLHVRMVFPVPVDIVQLVVNQFDRRLAAATPVIALPGDDGDDDTAFSTLSMPSPSLGQIVIEEGQPLLVECLAFGGSPQPMIDVKIGRRDVTDLFVMSNNVTLTGTQRAMRPVRHCVSAVPRDARHDQHQRLSGSQLIIRAADDGLIVRCDATVSGLESVSAAARLVVHCRYIGQCTPLRGIER